MDEMIRVLAHQYRDAINKAKDAGEFISDKRFRVFPADCCGDVCYMLAVYMMNHRIPTLWISNEGDLGSHAWLVVKDEQVSGPSGRPDYPEEIRIVLKEYGASFYNKRNVFYQEDDLKNGTIIDITADQFDQYHESVYVGKMDSFHKQFQYINAYEFIPLNNLDERLQKLYRIVEKYHCI